MQIHRSEKKHRARGGRHYPIIDGDLKLSVFDENQFLVHVLMWLVGAFSSAKCGRVAFQTG